ncbi:MAG: glycogen/starch synthase, partial [Planctomycetaceae bacterium]
NREMPVDLKTASIVICAWENPWARAGGLFAVVKEYAGYLRAQQRNVLILTPMHQLGGCPRNAENETPIQVPFDDQRINAAVRRVSHSGVDWFLLSAASFFEADGGLTGSSPYAYSGDSSDPEHSRLLRDSLFFSRAVPHALEALGADNLIVHLQDWQTAPAAVTIKDHIAAGGPVSAAVVLTMHNPYDHSLSDRTWRQLTEEPLPADELHTVYRRTLERLDAPPATVSREFSVDLRNDGLQTLYFANHLQPILEQTGIIGVDNGPFEEMRDPFPSGDCLAVKQHSRTRMLRLLEEYQQEEQRVTGWLEGADGGRLTSLPDTVPFFMMAGRLDPRQKGFDIFVRAIREFLGPQQHDGRFLLATEPGDAPPAYVDDLLGLGEEFPGRVLICAFRMQRGYFECQAGATFSVWPSFYEPFGGVSEFFLKGTPAVARQTGGLRQQVFDVRLSDRGTGITYDLPGAGSRAEWQAIMDAGSPDSREREPLYREHIRHLTDALVRAASTFQDSDAYDRLLGNLYPVCQQFSWERVWQEYSEVYQTACCRSQSPAGDR